MEFLWTAATCAELAKHIILFATNGQLICSCYIALMYLPLLLIFADVQTTATLETNTHKRNNCPAPQTARNSSLPPKWDMFGAYSGFKGIFHLGRELVFGKDGVWTVIQNGIQNGIQKKMESTLFIATFTTYINWESMQHYLSRMAILARKVARFTRNNSSFYRNAMSLVCRAHHRAHNNQQAAKPHQIWRIANKMW